MDEPITRPRAEIDALTAANCCVCCGLPGQEAHHGQWWCSICLGRGHHEDGPMLANEDAEGSTDA